MHDQIRELMQAQPFVPFTLVMASGERYDVNHPENALLLKNFLHVSANGGQYAKILYLPHVCSLERLTRETI